ncbi:hypothetical protein CMT52_15170 [Elizabethkingia anophelis]|uniref:WavE lipopolysaccharide synthesis family protein n=1 Tax=Elizabethkingia anophelis TaxID=1117645 RepID=UPI0009992C95|nr:WavE lipopolysaccharide synthesis family protein [Elizabethkingia anophelis]MDV3926651.1 hypothetical protein [Elizabethkingia anophelis]MDV4025673.1 hypothetical protein [Elizabethkingia anophelis]OPC55393.1 hypothetical protein BAY06_00455 [Elizabethkingia anophelis]
MISSSDISVVIQGPVVGVPFDLYDNQKTQQCIDNIRKHLPHAEIIVSTWEGTEVHHLKEVDKIVLSKDPGAITYNDYELKNIYNNNNRQIVSTYAGLKVVTKPYAIKFRCDFQIESLKFLEIFGKYKAVYKKRYFKERILCLSNTTRDPIKMPLLNHICDLIQFGYTEDLQKLWNIPLQIEPITTRKYKRSHRFWNDPMFLGNYRMQYAPEQYIWIAFLKQNNVDLSLKYFCQIPLFKISRSITEMVDNFIVYNDNDWGLISPQRLLASMEVAISTDRWHELYENICIAKSKRYIIKQNILVISCSFLYFKKNVRTVCRILRDKSYKIIRKKTK